MKIRVLFVCLGNICRSPMAEAVFQRLVDDAGLAENFIIDSAGTGAWHVGETAHSGTLKVLRSHGIHYTGRARQVEARDFDEDHSYIIAMDKSNVDRLYRRFGDHPRVHRILDFAREHDDENVPDPYYTGNFDYVYELIEDGAAGLLAEIQREHGL